MLRNSMTRCVLQILIHTILGIFLMHLNNESGLSSIRCDVREEPTLLRTMQNENRNWYSIPLPLESLKKGKTEKKRE